MSGYRYRLKASCSLRCPYFGESDKRVVTRSSEAYLVFGAGGSSLG